MCNVVTRARWISCHGEHGRYIQPQPQQYNTPATQGIPNTKQCRNKIQHDEANENAFQFSNHAYDYATSGSDGAGTPEIKGNSENGFDVGG